MACLLSLDCVGHGVQMGNERLLSAARGGVVFLDATFSDRSARTRIEVGASACVSGCGGEPAERGAW